MSLEFYSCTKYMGQNSNNMGKTVTIAHWRSEQKVLKL